MCVSEPWRVQLLAGSATTIPCFFLFWVSHVRTSARYDACCRSLACRDACAMPTVIAVDSTTQLTLDLQFERIKLLEMETLMRESHPAVQLQKLRVVENEAALYAMLEKGHEIDEPQVNSCLDLLLEKTR